MNKEGENSENGSEEQEVKPKKVAAISGEYLPNRLKTRFYATYEPAALGQSGLPIGPTLPISGGLKENDIADQKAKNSDGSVTSIDKSET